MELRYISLDCFIFVLGRLLGPASKDTELFFGINHSQLFRGLRHKLLSVLKAVLLEAKVLDPPSVQLFLLRPW